MEAILFLPLLGAAVGYLATPIVVSATVGLTVAGPVAGGVFAAT